MAYFIVIFFLMLGIAAIMVAKPYIKSKTQNKLPLHICNIFFIIGIIIYISIFVCMSIGKHIDSNFVYTEYPIQKLTFTNVYFDDRNYSFNESYMNLEEPDKDFVNIVIEVKEEYTIQWLFKIKVESNEYHVYLSKELYHRLQDGNVIYKRE